MMCENLEVRKETSSSQQNELIIGKSQFGKTYYASNEAADIIDRGETVHMIDIANSWSEEDKLRLGAVRRYDIEDGLTIFFPTVESVIKSAPYIANAFNFTSSEVITVLKDLFRTWLIRRNGVVYITDIINDLNGLSCDKKYAFQKAANKAYVKISNTFAFHKLKLVVNKEKAEDLVLDSSIWDLSSMDKEGASMVAQLLMFSMLETRRAWFKKCISKQRSFIIIDEFQNIDCTRNSVVGTCLTESQRVGLFLILISQFIDGKYSDAVLHQLKQGGHFVYFRVTEEEVVKISKQLAYNINDQKKIQKILTTLPRGCCLYKGRHYLGDSTTVSEELRIVKVVTEDKTGFETDSRGTVTIYR